MKPRRTQDAAPLSATVAAVLLGGWAAKPPGDIPEDDDGLFDLFEMRDAGVTELWAAHEPYLRTLAAAWGWSGGYTLADGRALYFAEFVSLPWAKQAAHWQAR